MKIQNRLIVVLSMFCFLACAKSAFAQENKFKEDFEKMSFEVEMDKYEYLLLEPIPIKFTVSNETNNLLKTLKPSFQSDIRIRIHFKGITKNYWDLFGISIYQLRMPVALQPGEQIVENAILISQLSKMFSEPGIYQIEIVLTGNGTEKTDTFEITIKEPSGINKEAFEFLKNYENETRGETLFGWKGATNNKGGKNPLEEFAGKFGSSDYGEYVTYYLGNYYLYGVNDFEKARVEFEKLKTGENSIIAKEAKKSLADIEIKKADLQKIQKQKEKPQ